MMIPDRGSNSRSIELSFKNIAEDSWLGRGKDLGDEPMTMIAGSSTSAMNKASSIENGCKKGGPSDIVADKKTKRIAGFGVASDNTGE